MRSMFVAPGVLRGTPAVTDDAFAGLCETFPRKRCDRRGSIMSSRYSSRPRSTTQCVPQTSDRRRAVPRTGDKAMMGTWGAFARRANARRAGTRVANDRGKLERFGNLACGKRRWRRPRVGSGSVRCALMIEG